MSGRLVSEARELSRAEGAAFGLLLTFAELVHHQDPTRTIKCLAEDLAREARLRRSSFYKALGDLRELGEVTQLDGGGGRSKPSVWRMADLRALYGCERPPGMGRFRSPRRVQAQRPLMGAVQVAESVPVFDGVAPKTVRTPDALGAHTVQDADGIGAESVRESVRASRAQVMLARNTFQEQQTAPLTPAAFAAGESPPARSGSRANGTNPRAVAARAAQAAAVAGLSPPPAAAVRAWADAREWLAGMVSETTWDLYVADAALVAVRGRTLIVDGPLGATGDTPIFAAARRRLLEVAEFDVQYLTDVERAGLATMSARAA